MGYNLKTFNVFSILCRHWSRHIPNGAAYEAEWNAKFSEYEKKYPEEAAEFKSIITGELPAGWEKALPVSSSYIVISFICIILYFKGYFHSLLYCVSCHFIS